MRPEIFAIFAAFAWGVSGCFEKKGLLIGNIPPQLGITIRTAVALVILGAFSFSQWKQLPGAGPKAIIYIILGGGILAGACGMLSFYVAIKGAPLGRVMPIAFTSPLFGALMGLALGGEQLTMKTALGTIMTVGGIILLTIK